MKKTILVISMAAILLISGVGMVIAQEQPAPKKDTVNMDTDAKPTFYYAVEDDKVKDPSAGGGSLLSYIGFGAIGLALVGGAVYFFAKKKK